MKQTKNSVKMEYDIINPTTGELIPMEATNTEINEYYTIRNLTTRINNMDFMTTMSEVCNSSKDIKTLKHLLELHNSDNTVVIPNITRLAKDLGISRAKVNVILSKSIEHNLFKKLDIGTYLINPYIFIGRRIRSNKNRERLQKQWTELEYLK